MCIKQECTVKGNARNPEFIGNLDKGSGDMTVEVIVRERERCAVPNAIASDLP